MIKNGEFILNIIKKSFKFILHIVLQIRRRQILIINTYLETVLYNSRFFYLCNYNNHIIIVDNITMCFYFHLSMITHMKNYKKHHLFCII